MKDDAIAQLSDQLLAISTRLQDLERKPLDIEENDGEQTKSTVIPKMTCSQK